MLRTANDARVGPWSERRGLTSDIRALGTVDPGVGNAREVDSSCYVERRGINAVIYYDVGSCSVCECSELDGESSRNRLGNISCYFRHGMAGHSSQPPRPLTASRWHCCRRRNEGTCQVCLKCLHTLFVVCCWSLQVVCIVFCAHFSVTIHMWMLVGRGVKFTKSLEKISWLTKICIYEIATDRADPEGG